ncbi:MAG TPA: enolase C-terminal domain-like protein [bacterium]|nr:enolase C-terminal domain-like protein [bacterium]HPO10075.1 enolase C-terminal domain-like protein [bacterium]
MKIERLEAFPVEYPTRGRFKFLEGPKGEPLGRRTVLVKMTADDGSVGWGESVPSNKWSYETVESVTTTLRNYLAPVLNGLDPFDLPNIHKTMNAIIGPGFSTGMPICKAGVDMAIHDLCCRKLNCSLARYWGRPEGGSVTLSWTLNPISLDRLDESIQEGLHGGYRNFNVKIAPDINYDLELCRRVKERVPTGFLWADANGGYDLPSALAVAPQLADLGVDVLECPLPPNHIAGYRRLHNQRALPITMDEGVLSPHDLLEFIHLDMLDGLTIKPARCGGLLAARRQIEILLDTGMIFLGSGLTEPDVGLSASLALYGAYGLAYPAALNGPQYLTDSVIETPFCPVDGKLPVPAGPGLGVTVIEEKIQALSAVF